MTRTILQAQLSDGEVLTFACKLDKEDSDDYVRMYTDRPGLPGDEPRVRVYMSRAQFFKLCGAASHLAANLAHRLENDARGVPPPAPPEGTDPQVPPIAGRES
jgi:hypothetical protein